tara:strand:+ start:1174 stop:1647 length:474 start_codon:yes stop_codon:yes gene_type:complete
VVKEIDDFISNKESTSLINFHKENFNLNSSYCKKHRETEVIQCMNILDNILINKLFVKLYKLIKSINTNCTINYFEIVKWSKNEFQDKHIDFDFHPYTSILYLNDNFKGGETVVKNKIINPKKCKLISFEGNKLIHSVNKIIEGERYTVPCWYKKIN